MSSCNILGKLENEIISIITNEVVDHFGGGLSGERMVRESEAYFLSQKIWGRISKSIAGSTCETLEVR